MFLYHSICFSLLFTSCYTYTFNVGEGAQSGENHYFVYGLVQGNQTDFKSLAGSAENYTITIKHSFIDGLVNAITFGIYTPTMTEVQKL